MTNVTVFLENIATDSKLLNQITDFTGFKIHDYTLFIFNNTSLLCNFSHALLSFKHLLPKVKNFTFFGNNVTDIITEEIVEFLKSNCHSKKSVEYYIYLQKLNGYAT